MVTRRKVIAGVATIASTTILPTEASSATDAKHLDQPITSTYHVASGRAALAVEIVGNGTPVIFLHSNVCDRRMWRPQLDRISLGYKVIAYDRRGFGETRAEREDFSARADLMAVLDATAGEEPVALVGCSLGGRIVLDAAIRHPSRVRAVVMIAPNVAGGPEPVYTPELEKLMADSADADASRDLDRVNAMKARIWLDGPLAPEGRVKGPARNLFLEMNGIALRAAPVGSDVDVPPFFHRLAEIEVPALVVWGDLDFPHIQERCRHIAATVPNGSGHEMTGTAHLPSLDQPAEVTSLLSEFLARC